MVPRPEADPAVVVSNPLKRFMKRRPVVGQGHRVGVFDKRHAVARREAIGRVRIIWSLRPFSEKPEPIGLADVLPRKPDDAIQC